MVQQSGLKEERFAIIQYNHIIKESQITILSCTGMAHSSNVPMLFLVFENNSNYSCMSQEKQDLSPYYIFGLKFQHFFSLFSRFPFRRIKLLTQNNLVHSVEKKNHSNSCSCICNHCFRWSCLCLKCNFLSEIW